MAEPTPAPTPAPASPAPAIGSPPRREGSRAVRQTAADMVRSLGLVLGLIVILLLVGPGRTLLFPGDNRQPAVSYSDQAAGFGRVAHTPAVLPGQLPASWRANGADLSTTKRLGTHLHIGWGLPGNRYAGLDESNGAADALIVAVLGNRGLRVVGTRQLGAQTWTVRRSQRGETALTTAVGAVTVVVTGSATDAELDQLARSLH